MNDITINEVAQALIEMKGTTDLLIGRREVSFTHGGRRRVVRIASDITGAQAFEVYPTGNLGPPPTDMLIRIAGARAGRRGL